MARPDDSGEIASLCQQAIHNADRGLFHYLSFFAAIHAAAFTALASQAVGFEAFVGAFQEPGSTPRPVATLVPSLAGLMSILCFFAGRGLSDAARRREAAIRLGKGQEKETGKFFEEVYVVPSRRGIWNRLLSNHRRTAVLLTGVGLLWAVFLLSLVNGFPLLFSGDLRNLPNSWRIAGSAVAAVMVLIGLAFLSEQVPWGIFSYEEEGDEPAEGTPGQTNPPD